MTETDGKPATDFPLFTAGEVSTRARELGIERFSDLAEHVRRLPYGRVDSTSSATRVLDENIGTCSSKHALLATAALEAGRSDIELMVGIYEMNARNTPGVAAALERHCLTSIPEAHCFLRRDGRRLDYTGLPSGLESPFDSLMLEQTVDPAKVFAAKPLLHRAFLKEWCDARGLDADRAWHAREDCIAALATKEGQASA